MNLNKPKNITYYVSLGLGALGLIASLIPLGFLTTLAFWLVLAGLVLLAQSVFLYGNVLVLN